HGEIRVVAVEADGFDRPRVVTTGRREVHPVARRVAAEAGHVDPGIGAGLAVAILLRRDRVEPADEARLDAQRVAAALALNVVTHFAVDLHRTSALTAV